MAEPRKNPNAPLPGTEAPKLPFMQAIRHRFLNIKRQEMPSPLPIAPPIGYKKTPSLSDQIRDMVRSEKLAAALAAQGVETFEESDDFDIPDDPIDPQSAYEADFEGDALEPFRKPEPVIRSGRKEYGHVEEFLTDHPEYDPRTPPSEQLRPEPTPSPKAQRGVGEDVIAPGETPLPPASASEPQNRPLGFFRRG